MKRYGNLWTEITSFENLVLAARKAQRNKRFCKNVLKFNFNLENELLKLQEELKTKKYKVGQYRTFEIFDPKPRMISAAPYRDRVVHHALCNVIVPLIEATFIEQSYANRIGYGTHRALKQFIQATRRYRYILQCDVQQYFPSIDHTILKQQIRRKIKCADTLWLIDQIIDGSNLQVPVLNYFPGDDLLTPVTRRKGLPIGNLSSQFFANVYLNGFDHYVREQLKFKSYLRYVDDFSLFANNSKVLDDARHKIEGFMQKLRLKIHGIKSQRFETCHGANFLGFRVLPGQIRIRNDNLRRSRVRFREMQQAYHLGEMALPELVQRIQSWEAHLQTGDTYRLRQHVFQTWCFYPPRAQCE